ncbi:MAG: tannase/feruloyl esterase family alpha/beta hydrolase [Kofleriaceae bacterium]
MKLAIAVTLASACASPTPRGRAADCDALRSLALPHVSIVGARVVTAKPGPYCRVDGISRPTADSEIRFEVVIPVGSAWNGRYQQIGNGGFAGLVPEDDLASAVALGNAAAGTDDGHASTRAINAEWALGHPEKVIDFGYRAVKETHDAALGIIRAYTGRAPRFHYFTGCSDGGREGLMEAQRYPDDFDGIVAGAPANHATQLLTAMAWNELALDAGPISLAKLPAIQHAALAACGNADGVIEDPLACHFDPSVLRCTGPETDGCLTEPQLTALAKIYDGPHDPSTGARLSAGLEPGAEAEPGSWDAWIIGSERGDAAQLRFAQTFFRYMVFGDPQFDLHTLRFDRDIAPARAKLGPLIDSDQTDLHAFAARGGKVLQFHGWNDQVIAPRDSIEYYNAVTARMGDTSRFYRLFMIPGMLHCEGGRGPRELPTLEAIEAWVESGRVPEQLTAQPAAGTRVWTLCPYPKHGRCEPPQK